MTTERSRMVIRRGAGQVLFYAILTLFGVVMVLPFYWSLITSIMPNDDIFSMPIKWIPLRLTAGHYRDAFTIVPYGRFFLNSLLLATLGVAANIFFGSLGGYAFAKLRFPGRALMFRLLLTSLMIPAVITLIPQFFLLKGFPLLGGNNILGHGGQGLLNTYWAVVLPGAAGAFAVFFMRQFFLTLPDALAEAARMEGAGEFRIFGSVYLPLTAPGLATLSIMTFQAGWNNFFWPMIVLNDPLKATIQMGLQAFSYNHQTEYGALMAGSVVATIPILAIFAYAQKYFVRGIAFSGIKL